MRKAEIHLSGSGSAITGANPFEHVLFSEIQAFQKFLIFRTIVPLEVFQQFPALADELQQAPAGMVIFPVCLEMLGEEVDPLGQNGNLDRRRTCIRAVRFIVVY